MNNCSYLDQLIQDIKDNSQEEQKSNNQSFTRIILEKSHQQTDTYISFTQLDSFMKMSSQDDCKFSFYSNHNNENENPNKNIENFSILNQNQLRIKLKEICKKLFHQKQELQNKLEAVELENTKFKEAKISHYNVLTKEIEKLQKKDEQVLKFSIQSFKQIIEYCQNLYLEIETIQEKQNITSFLLFQSSDNLTEVQVEQATNALQLVDEKASSLKSKSFEIISADFKIISNKEYQKLLLLAQEIRLKQDDRNQKQLFENEQKINCVLSNQIEEKNQMILNLQKKLEHKNTDNNQNLLNNLKNLTQEKEQIQNTFDQLEYQLKDAAKKLQLNWEDNLTFNLLRTQQMIFEKAQEIISNQQSKLNYEQDYQKRLEEEINQLKAKETEYLGLNQTIKKQQMEIRNQEALLLEANNQNQILDELLQKQNESISQLQNFSQQKQNPQFSRQISEFERQIEELQILMKEQEQIYQQNIQSEQQKQNQLNQKLQTQNQQLIELEQQNKSLDEQERDFKNQISFLKQLQKTHLDKLQQEQANNVQLKLQLDQQDMLYQQKNLNQYDQSYMQYTANLATQKQKYLQQIEDLTNLVFFQHNTQIYKLHKEYEEREQKLQFDHSQILAKCKLMYSQHAQQNVFVNSDTSPSNKSFQRECDKFYRELDKESVESKRIQAQNPFFQMSSNNNGKKIGIIRQQTYSKDYQLIEDNSVIQEPTIDFQVSQFHFAQTFSGNFNKQQSIQDYQQTIQVDNQCEDIFPPFDHRICLRCKRNDMIAPNFCKYKEIDNIKDYSGSGNKAKKWKISKEHIYGINISWRQKREREDTSVQYSSNNQKAESSSNTILTLINDSLILKMRKDRRRGSSIEDKQGQKRSNSNSLSVSGSSNIFDSYK